jgi:hypothetical protein
MLNLKIPEKIVYKKKTFSLSEEALSLLSEYHQAASESIRTGLTENEVLEAILKKHILSDKKFKKWQEGKN